MRVVVIVLGCVSSIQAGDVRTEPQYKEWLLQLQDGPDNKRRDAAESLRHFGPKALPALAALRVALTKAELADATESVILTLAAIGHEAKDALPTIIKRYEEANLRERAVGLACLKLGDPSNRTFLRVCLERGRQRLEPPSYEDGLPVLLHDAPADVVPALLALANRGTTEVRRYVLRCCLCGTVEYELAHHDGNHRFDPIRWTSWPTKAREALLEYARSFLTDHDTASRFFASSLIMAFAPEEVRTVFPICFQAIVQQPDFALHLNQSLFLPTACVRWLVEYNIDPSEEIRRLAQRLLRHLFRDDLLGCLLPLRFALRHRNPAVVVATIGLLDREEYLAEELWSILATLLDHPDASVRLRAAACLIFSDAPYTARYLPILREQLANPGNGEHHLTLRLIAELGPRAVAMRPALLRLHQQDHIPHQAPHTLARVDPSAAATYLPVFAKILDTATGGPPHAILQTLAHVGPPAKPFLPKLRATLAKTVAHSTKLHLATAIIRIDPKQTTDTLHLFRACASTANLDDNVEALVALRELGPLAKSLVPWLQEQYRTAATDEYRALLASTIFALDPKNQIATDVLRSGINGTSPHVWLPEVSVLGDLAAPFLPDIIKRLDTKRDDRVEYIRALHALAPIAAEAVPALQKLRTDPLLGPHVTLALRRIDRHGRGPR